VTQAYPLHWPMGFPRTKAAGRSQFRTEYDGAYSNAMKSLRSFAVDTGRDVTNVIVSSNITMLNSSPKDAGLPNITPHVMKHTVISWLAEKHPVDMIADFTETSPATVRRVYRKVNPKALRPLADTLAGGLIAPPERNTPNPGNPQALGKTGARDGIRTRDPLDHNEEPQRLRA
jgi:hypothetical protein